MVPGFCARGNERYSKGKIARRVPGTRKGRKGREQVRVSGRERMPRVPDKRGPHSCMRLLAAQRVQSILVPPLGPPFRSIPYTRRRAKGPRARSCTKSTISCEGMVKLASNSANLSRICRMQARFEPSNSSFLYYLGNCTQFLRNLSSFLYKLPGREERRGGDACRRPSPIRAQGKKGSKDGDGEKEREAEERPRLLHPPQPTFPSRAATSRQRKSPIAGA